MHEVDEGILVSAAILSTVPSVTFTRTRPLYHHCLWVRRRLGTKHVSAQERAC